MKKKLKFNRILNKNLGCQKAVFSALNWFSNEKRNNTYDILPNKTFF